MSELKAAGASWVQLDEPFLVMDLQEHELGAFSKAYSYLEEDLDDTKLVVETYFADVPVETYKQDAAMAFALPCFILACLSFEYWFVEQLVSGFRYLNSVLCLVPFRMLIGQKSIFGIGFDLVRGINSLNLIKEVGFPDDKYLFAGLVDGRNIWANDLSASLSILEDLEKIVTKGMQPHAIHIMWYGYTLKLTVCLNISNFQISQMMITDILADKLVVSTSCSLMHTAVDLINETNLDDELKSWLAFAAQKINETVALAKSLAGQKDEVKSLVHIGYIYCNLKWKQQHLLYSKLLTF